MNPFEMTTVIVIAALIAGVLRARYKHAPAAGAAGISNETRLHIDAQDRRIAQLEERIKALEAVVSEPQFHLKQQFRDLEGG
ncbi:hypothetical protein [Hydrocarboniphaga sp.]|uniref:hypothetical protein n=1 Tax=Hydrocarboniphaga sp. TaxID=2033016 RepID=UPI003D120CA5